MNYVGALSKRLARRLEKAKDVRLEEDIDQIKTAEDDISILLTHEMFTLDEIKGKFTPEELVLIWQQGINGIMFWSHADYKQQLIINLGYDLFADLEEIELLRTDNELQEIMKTESAKVESIKKQVIKKLKQLTVFQCYCLASIMESWSESYYNGIGDFSDLFSVLI